MDQLFSGVPHCVVHDFPFPQGAAFQQTDHARNRRANALPVKHLDDLSDFCLNILATGLTLLFPILQVPQSNCLAQFWEAGVDDRFGDVKSRVDRPKRRRWILR